MSQKGRGILCVYNSRDSQPMPCSLSAMVVCLSQDGCVYGAQRLSGRVPDLRPRGRGFKPQGRHCIVSLSKTH